MNRISLLIGMLVLVYASVIGLAQTPRQAPASSPATESAASFDRDRGDDHARLGPVAPPRRPQHDRRGRPETAVDESKA